jgi:uncharacterized protein YrzB (UPF0473 family)
MDEREVITLYDDEGEEVEFEVLGVINVDDNEYAILVPYDEELDLEAEDYEEEQGFIFRIDRDENGEDVLVEVEDDDEFDKVREAWEAVFDGLDEDFEDDEE